MIKFSSVSFVSVSYVKHGLEVIGNISWAMFLCSLSNMDWFGRSCNCLLVSGIMAGL